MSMKQSVPGVARGLALAVVAAVAMAAAQAGSLGWMKGSTASFFTDRDWELVGETLTATLDTAADGETRQWSNDRSGAHGRMTPLSTEPRGDATCRKLRVESTAKGSSSSHVYVFCRRGDGGWGIAQPAG